MTLRFGLLFVVLPFFELNAAKKMQPSLGVSFLDFSGLSLKADFEQDRKAVEGFLAWHANSQKSDITVAGNYLIVIPNSVRVSSLNMNGFYGLGLKTQIFDRLVAIQTPIGASYRPKTIDLLEVSTSIVPRLRIFPESTFSVGLSISIRILL